MENNYFIELNNINVNEHVEKKNNLSYLSWPYAWAEVKKRHPDATYTIYDCVNPQGYVCNYFSDGRTAWVKTGVTINGIEHIEELPVMDFKNKSIMLDQLTSFDVNKAIQRSLTKAVARHGLGLYIYAGEDLPEEEKKEKETTKLNEEQTDRLELESHCEELGIDLKEPSIANFIRVNLAKTSGKEELDEKFNLGQYNNILAKLIERKTSNK